jgi:hypothetical protein
MSKYCPLFLSLILATVSLHAAESESGEARADRLLAAMGGREAWARTKSVIIAATHYNLTAPTTYANRIVNDFIRPRVLFEAHAPGWDRWSSLDGESGNYRRNQEAVIPRPADRIASDFEWWKTNLYRTLHRLAIRDADLTVHAVESDRLEIHDKGKRLNWFRLSADGSPVLYGTGENSAATIIGPLKTAGNGVRYPLWGAGDLGGWRYQIDNFVPNPALSVREFSIPHP